jgi:hypothetical protein
VKPVTLNIESGYESQTVTLDDELTIGRTDQADVQLEDGGLSRINTTIFRDGDDVLIVDENSTNGTFIDGSRISGSPQILFDGDRITLGSETTILVSFKSEDDSPKIPAEKPRKKSAIAADPTVRNYAPKTESGSSKAPDSLMVWYIGAGSIFFILLFGIIGVAIAVWYDKTQTGPSRTVTVTKNQAIPIRVIDPLGRQKQEDLDELVQYWEVQEKEVTAEDLDTQSESSDGSTEAEYYKVSIDYWKSQRAKAFQKRNGPTGIWPAGLKVPKILRGDGVVKQTAKIREMTAAGYKMPLDFADLAEKRSQKLLVELPMATEYWVLEVGGSSTKGPFTSFDFKEHSKNPIAPVGSPDYNILSALANDFSGEKYDMNNPDHRRQMKIRLLRMFNPRAKLALEELAKHYFAKFNRPLRVTSLSRSMLYQMDLNKVNANSYRGGPGRLPPHTSGCAFDLARKHMSAEEQNYVMAKLAEMETRGTLDALIEGNVNACFHVFVYEDGKVPKGY